MSLFSKKSIILFVVFMVVFQASGFVFVSPKKAEAVFPVTIIAHSPTAIFVDKAADKVVDTWLETALKEMIKIAKEVFRKRLLDYLVNRVIYWIGNGGPGGSAQFFTDLGKVVENAANDALGEAIWKSKFKFLCEPFNYSIRLSLGSFQTLPPVACTLTDVVGNIEDFYDDFSKGGLAAFSHIIQPQGNPYGAYLITQEERDISIAGAASKVVTEFNSSQGFIGTKRCKAFRLDPKTGKDSKECISWETTTPGITIAGKIQNALDIDLNSLLSADEFTTYAAAIIDAIINRLVKAGKDGLLGLAHGAGERGGDQADLPGTVYVCDKNLNFCQPKFEDEISDGQGQTYSSLEACNKDCLEEIDDGGDDAGTFNDNPQACDAGVFVRGRPAEKCEGGECGRCTGIGGESAQDCCFVFCKHTKDSQWKPNTEGKQFTADEVNPVCSYFGLSSPADGCLCKTKIGEYPFYNNNDEGQFTKCSECNGQTIFSGQLCKKTSYCDSGEGGDDGGSGGQTESCCYGLDSSKNEIKDCVKISDSPEVCVDKNDQETILTCHKLACPVGFEKIKGKCSYNGKLKECYQIQPEPNSVCLVKTGEYPPLKALPCENFIKD